MSCLTRRRSADWDQYDRIAAADKHLRFIKADHYLREPPGARDEAADLIAAWAAERT